MSSQQQATSGSGLIDTYYHSVNKSRMSCSNTLFALWTEYWHAWDEKKKENKCDYWTVVTSQYI